MKSCFGYVRVSTVKQGDGVSLEAQQEAISAYARAHNLEIIKWFEEKQTAAKRGRPIFARMLTEARRKRVYGVIFHRIDRSTRNPHDWARVSDLSEAGVKVHFATESLDFDTRGGRLTADIQAVIAADYVRNLRDETIKGLHGRLKQGLYPFRAPLGYLDTGRGKPKIIDPVRGPLIRQLFELYASGEFSLWSIVPAAEQIGLLNHWGRPLAKTSIEKILRNPFYMGLIEVRSSRKTYKGVHEPLISATLFERAAAVRQGRDNKKSTRHNHLFRGLFRCGFCQGAMIAERQKGHVYYRCHERACETKGVREEVLDMSVRATLAGLTLSPEKAEHLRNKFVTLIESSQEAKLAQSATLELEKVQQRLSRLADKLIDSVIDDATYQEKRAALLIEQKRCEEMQAKLRDRGQLVDTLDAGLERMKRLILHYESGDPCEKRSLVRFATSNRRVCRKEPYLEPSIAVRSLQNAENLTNVTHIDPLLELLLKMW